MVRNLVEHGAALFATTISDKETPAEKCEEEEEGYLQVSEYLYGKRLCGYQNVKCYLNIISG